MGITTWNYKKNISYSPSPGPTPLAVKVYRDVDYGADEVQGTAIEYDDATGDALWKVSLHNLDPERQFIHVNALLQRPGWHDGPKSARSVEFSYRQEFTLFSEYGPAAHYLVRHSDALVNHTHHHHVLCRAQHRFCDSFPIFRKDYLVAASVRLEVRFQRPELLWDGGHHITEAARDDDDDRGGRPTRSGSAPHRAAATAGATAATAAGGSGSIAADGSAVDVPVAWPLSWGAGSRSPSAQGGAEGAAGGKDAQGTQVWAAGAGVAGLRPRRGIWAWPELQPAQQPEHAALPPIVAPVPPLVSGGPSDERSLWESTWTSEGSVPTMVPTRPRPTPAPSIDFFNFNQNATWTLLLETVSVNGAYTRYELGLRYTFLAISVVVFLRFMHQMNKLSSQMWGYQQKWICVLLGSLCLFDGPLSAGRIYAVKYAINLQVMCTLLMRAPHRLPAPLRCLAAACHARFACTRLLPLLTHTHTPPVGLTRRTTWRRARARRCGGRCSSTRRRRWCLRTSARSAQRASWPSSWSTSCASSRRWAAAPSGSSSAATPARTALSATRSRAQWWGPSG